jgi:hypothetical protein
MDVADSRLVESPQFSNRKFKEDSISKSSFPMNLKVLYFTLEGGEIYEPP